MSEATTDSSVYSKVKHYYGQTIKTAEDLATGTCTLDRNTFTGPIREAIDLIHPEIKEKNYGCGVVFPEGVDGCHVLDLGSGAGLDCFVLSRLVGETGHVIGVDMTKEQLEVARKHIDYHTEKFGYSQANVEFREGYIECLDKADIKSESVDFIVSNCVMNLSPDKGAVLREAYRVLKPGGQMYFSDIYSNQEIPQTLKDNTVLWGECISGALKWTDLIKLAVEIGFAPPILVKSVLFTFNNAEVTQLLASADSADLKFCSATYRLVKTDWDKSSTHDPLVDVEYKGTVSGYEESIRFSYAGDLMAHTKVAMPQSTASILSQLPMGMTIVGPSSAQTTPHPSLSSFLTTDPFQVANGIQEMAVPKGLSGSCKQEGGCCC